MTMPFVRRNFGRFLQMLVWTGLCSCDSGTGDRTVSFSLMLHATQDTQNGAGHFVTSAGWMVDLEQACLAVGPIYFFRNAGLLVRSWNRLATGVVGVAHAHPGDAHFNGGEIRGEWVGQTVLDLLSAQPKVFTAQNALLGAVQSFTVRLDPPRAVLANDANLPCLHGHQAWIKGVAHRLADQTEIAFEGGLDIPNVGNNRNVEGLPLEARFDDRSLLSVTLNPRVWMDLAQFETLIPTSNDQPRIITPGTQVHTAWFIGARGAGVFTGRNVQAAAVGPS